ncbi:MAG: hypothetical protein A2X86_08320 [Bdellovibrionales bacterium GWA2_49_15]|nr:MAG: hypothetical protein A2X86_08320 [Bdellovibrionales bacterium GWA2_49_15]HAZ11234.1 SAM-dependent methyltransferase [Bdellovibrionales bacterium]
MSTDLFSKQANLYSRYRPQYPDALYKFLLSHCAKKELAWDCATGNGQAALDLARFFTKVIATDLSERQIKSAVRAENVEYRVLKAEESLGVKDHSIDLITVAQALHWFDLDKFYAEVKRVLRPTGIFATWAYAFHLPIQPNIDSSLTDFYFNILGPFWKKNNKLIFDNYKELSFPFREIATPEIYLEVNWSLEDLIGYFRTWSSTQLFIDQSQIDPTLELYEKVLPYWGAASEKKILKWRLIFKVGELV